MKRVAVILLAFLTVPLTVLWWVGSGILAGSYDSACGDSLAADLSFVAANVGFVLGVAALVAGLRRRVRTGGWLLAGYLVLFVASTLVVATCEQ